MAYTDSLCTDPVGISLNLTSTCSPLSSYGLKGSCVALGDVAPTTTTVAPPPVIANPTPTATTALSDPMPIKTTTTTKTTTSLVRVSSGRRIGWLDCLGLGLGFLLSALAALN